MSDYAASSTAAPSRPARTLGAPLRVLGDERLARLAATGNERAFATLYERHHQALYRYCRTIVRHDEDAADVLQTTMVRALAALGRRVPDAPMRPWLFRIAHNEAISLLRRRRQTTDLDQAPELEGPRLEARVEERSRLATLVADLNELPERQRSALVMRELSGLSHDDIATALDISVSAAKQAIFDARTGLQEFAKGRGMECAEVQRIISERDGRMLRGRPLRAHLRGCDSCRALRDAIGARRSDLAALAPPLPAAAATGLLSGILGGGHGGGAGGLLSGVAAKVTAGATTGKALAGVAVATVAVGTAEVLPATSGPAERDGARPPAAANPAPPAPAAGAGSVAPARGTIPSSSPARPYRGARSESAARRRAGGATTPAAASRPDAVASTHPGRHPKAGSSAAPHHRSPSVASHPARGRRPAASHPATARRPTTPRRPARRKPTTPVPTHAPSRPNAPATARRSYRPTPSPAASRPGRSRPAAGANGGPTPPPPSRPTPAVEAPVPAAPTPPSSSAPAITSRAVPAGPPVESRAG